MTPQEFKQTRERQNMTKAELAKFMGVSVQAVMKWESGERSVNPMAEKILIWLDQGALTP